MPERLEASSTKPHTLARMAKNAFANLFRTGTGWLIILFLPPLLVRVLDKPAYGVWLLLLQLAAYVTVLDGGIQIAVARFVARGESLQEEGYLARFLSSTGLLMTAVSMATVLLTALASTQLTRVFPEIPIVLASDARFALLVLGASLALTLPFSIVAGFFVGLQKYEIPAIAGSAGKFAGALGTAWAAYHHQGLLAMASWVAAGNIVQCLTYVWFWRATGRLHLLRPSYAERALVGEFLVFCSAMFVTQFSSFLISGLDLPIVAAFDFHAAGYYGIAATLSAALIVPHSAIVNTLIPVAAGFSTRNDPVGLGQVLLKTTRFATALLCLILLPLLLLMPLFLRLWVGSEYATHSLLLAQLLVIAQFARLTMLPYAMIGFAAGQQQRMLVSPIAEGIVNLLCSLALVHFIGARGVALGTSIGALVGVWLHFSVSMKRTDCVVVSRRQLLWQGIGKPVALLSPLIACVMLIPRIPAPSLEVIATLFVEAILFALFWNLDFDAAERAQLVAVLRHFGRIPAALRP